MGEILWWLTAKVIAPAKRCFRLSKSIHKSMVLTPFRSLHNFVHVTELFIHVFEIDPALVHISHAHHFSEASLRLHKPFNSERSKTNFNGPDYELAAVGRLQKN